MKYIFPFFLFLTIALLFAHYPMILSGFKYMQTDPGDTRFNNYILEHIHLSIKNNFKNFFSPNFFYPNKNSLFYSDPQIFYYPFYGIFRFLGFEYDTSFQLFMIFSTILNFFLSFYLFHLIDKQKPFFNSFGALIFSSANMKVSQMGHQQLHPNFYILLSFISFYFIYKNYKENSKKTKIFIFIFLFSIIFQLLSGFYNFYSLFLYISFLVLFLFLLKRKEIFEFIKKYYLFLILSFLLFIILIFPYYKATRKIYKDTGKWQIIEVYSMLPQIKSYLYMGEENLIYGKIKLFNPPPTPHEQRLSLGFITTILLLISIYFLRKNFLIKLNLFVILSFFLLTIFIPPKFTFWKIIYEILPGANALRAITRLNLILLLPISYILLTFLKKIKEKFSILLCLLIIFEQANKTHYYDKFKIRKDVETIVEIVKRNKLPFYYSPLFGSDYFWKYQIDAMWASLLSGVPTINGYSGKYPKDWGLYENKILKEGDWLKIYSNLKYWFGDYGFLWIQTIPENKPFLYSDFTILGEKLHYFIDRVSNVSWKEYKNPIKIKKEKEIFISGWAKDLRFSTEKTKLYIKINDYTFKLNYGIKREDVAKVYGEDYIFSGFEGRIDSKYLNEKGNSISFLVVCSDKYISYKKTPLIFDLQNEKN